MSRVLTNRSLHSKTTLQAIVYLAAPVLVEQALTLAVGWTDWWLTGHYLEGDAPKAAMGLMAYVMWLIPNLFASVAIGATAMTARFVGGDRWDRASAVTNQSMLVGFLFAIITTVLAFTTASAFTSLMRLEGEAAAYAIEYMQIVAWVIPLIMIEQVGIACLRGSGDTFTGFVAKTVVVVVNILISAGLLLGTGPLPQLGWKALAIGTAAGHAVAGVIIGWRLLSCRSGIQWKVLAMKPELELIARLMRIGIPGGVDLLATLFCQFFFVALINRLGSAAAAAHGLAVQVEALAYLPGMAFHVAAATLAGQYLGANQPARARTSTLICVGFAEVIMCIAGLVFLFGGEQLTYFFTAEDVAQAAQSMTTAKRSAELLSIVAFSMPSLAIILVCVGAFRGAGDTRWPLTITLFGFLGVRIPLAVWLTMGSVSFGTWQIQGMELGVHGAWYAMLIDLLVRSVLVAARFLHGGWQRVDV